MKILVYPKDTNNPYQKLLYGAMPEDTTVEYFSFPTKSKIAGLLLYVPKLISYRLQGYSIFHIHWLYELGFIFKNPLLNYLSQLGFYYVTLKFITLIRLLGFRIVWTVHNVSTHEKQTVNDLFISKYLAWNASALIVHSQDTIDTLKALGISTAKTKIIPHGNYIGYYENTISRTDARKTLNLPGNETTFLYFGQIRAYKGVDLLLQTFERVLEKNPKAQLIIAGQCNDEELKKHIIAVQKKYPVNLFFFSKYISDTEIQNYFNASDITVLPFRRSTTSGSALLSLSFGKPLVFRRIGNMKDFPEAIGISYEPGTDSALQAAMEKALSVKDLPERGHHALGFMKKFDWENIREKTIKLYQSL
jgi:glycosyltransferase involved in cell wall biosynthesis